MKPREEAILQCQHLSNKADIAIMEAVIHEIYDSIVPIDANQKDPWKWVRDEYVSLFKDRNSDRGGHQKESIARMKQMFSANPEIRKEDVLGATKLYLSQTNSKYIMYPHYFLKKGVGSSATYTFFTWYEKYLEAKEKEVGRNSVTNTMQ